jgi:rod shape-determining protein MreC
LRELLKSSKRVSDRVLIGEILAVDLDPFTRQIVINKGNNFEVYNGQPILDADGVMGQIIHVGPFSSTAMLITDPNHAIPVELNRNGYRAIAIGTGGKGFLELTNIPNNIDIVIGDLLVTSGLGGRFPPGYPVGKISVVDADASQSYAKVTVTPSANLDRGREVMLVWSEDKKEKSAEALDAVVDGVNEASEAAGATEATEAAVTDTAPIEAEPAETPIGESN